MVLLGSNCIPFAEQRTQGGYCVHTTTSLFASGDGFHARNATANLRVFGGTSIANRPCTDGEVVVGVATHEGVVLPLKVKVASGVDVVAPTGVVVSEEMSE